MRVQALDALRIALPGYSDAGARVHPAALSGASIAHGNIGPAYLGRELTIVSCSQRPPCGLA